MMIGAHALQNRVFAAPMAGVTDRPFRNLARRFGAALAASEMVSAKPELRGSRKTRLRLMHQGEAGPVCVQIAGADPAMMAEAARFNADSGAQIIDINMGCPAKKVCNVMAGSALLADEALVGRILDAVVGAVDVPVTLKIRTGASPDRRNALRIAAIAEQSGVKMLAIHGRTRACGFSGEAEYETIAAVKSRAGIPIIANGDIRSPQDAKRVLAATGADGVMIGRAAHGRPWIFAEITHYLETGTQLEPPGREEIGRILLEHLDGLYALYGEEHGARVARKHIGWTLRGMPGGEAFRRSVVTIEEAARQREAVRVFMEEGLEAANESLTGNKGKLAA